MHARTHTRNLTIAALLCAIGIIIPLVSPVKILIEPASFTLASHVPIFLAMFISPVTAALVAVGTTLGFFLAGFPIVIVLRAATHLVFALLGAILLERRPAIIRNRLAAFVFALVIGFVHAVGEVLVVTPMYFGDMVAYSQGYTSVLLLVGVGSIVHSMVDFYLSLILWRGIQRVRKVDKK